MSVVHRAVGCGCALFRLPDQPACSAHAGRRRDVSGRVGFSPARVERVKTFVQVMIDGRTLDADALIDALVDARSVELSLVNGLTDAELLGPRGHFIEPPIWEIGHVGWFQEYWILRRLDGVKSLLPGSDDIYDSFHVSYKQRWDHAFPSREQTLEYLAEV